MAGLRERMHGLTERIQQGEEGAVGELDTLILGDGERPEDLEARARVAFEVGAVPALLGMLRQPQSSAWSAIAGCLWNISSVPDLAKDVAEAGAVGLLVEVIRRGVPDSMEYAAGALINLTIPELSKHIKECNGVEVLVRGLTGDNPVGHKLNCATALGNLFSDNKLAEELWEQGCVKECLSLVEDDDERVRINAMMALSRFAAFNMDFKKRIFDVSKAALVEILIMDSEACRCNAAGAFWNMTSAVDMPLHVFEAGIGPKLLTLLKDASDAETRHMAMGALWNLAASSVAASTVVDWLPDILGVVRLHMPGSLNPEQDLWLRFMQLIYNLSAFLDAAGQQKMRDHGIVELVQPFTKKREENMIHVFANLCVANLVGHIENHPLLVSDSQLIDEVLKVLKNSMAKEQTNELWFHLWSPIQGLANMSVNDANKKLIVEAGALEPVVEVLRITDDQKAQTYAAKLLSNIAFAYDLRVMVPGCEKILQHVADKGLSTQAQELAKLAVFQLSQRYGDQKKPKPKKGRHVMLSYPLKFQALFLRIKEFLQELGFEVWMDDAVDDMSSSVLEAMANAVEHSSVVVFCLSSAYKESEACRTEGEYAFRLRKPMIPVVTETGYIADGWLGALVANKLFVDMSTADKFQEKRQELLRELKNHGAQPSSQMEREQSTRRSFVQDVEHTRARAEEAELRVKELQKELHERQEERNNAAQRMQQVEQGLANLQAQMAQVLQRLEERPAAAAAAAAVPEGPRRKRGCNIS